ncbi:MAG: hypothetical protein HY329_19120 [Chloroflexi bacterium]|nr:hypothetical protein [Chloroflexota bacterium]
MHRPGQRAAMVMIGALQLLLEVVTACTGQSAPGLAGAPATRTAPARLVAADEGNPAVSWRGLLSRPVDPSRLTDVPGIEPVDLAPCGPAPAVRPDGKVIAVAVGWLGEGAGGQPVACNVGGGGEVRLFDLERWSWIGSTGARSDYVTALDWSWDGSRLYVATATRERGHVGGLGGPGEIGRLWIIDPSGQVIPRAVPLPYAIHRLDAAPDRRAVYLLGYQLDSTTGAERARVALPGVKLGQRRETDGAGQLVYQSYEPGVVIAPDGRRYFIARADEPIVDAVDLINQRVERTLRTDRQASGMESVLDSFARSALAKGGPVAKRSLAISLDGRRLYVTGHAATLVPAGAPGAVREARRPLGIVAIDTNTWTVRRFDAQSEDVTLSPDGGWLFAEEAPTWLRESGTIEPSPNERELGARLRVLDAMSGNEVATLVRDRLILQVAALGVDRTYVLSSGSDENRRIRQAKELVAFEAGTWRELARREGGHGLHLVVPIR